MTYAERERRVRYGRLLLIDVLGRELLEREPIVAAVCDKHLAQDDFSLHLCLGDVVRELVKAKRDIETLYVRLTLETPGFLLKRR